MKRLSILFSVAVLLAITVLVCSTTLVYAQDGDPPSDAEREAAALVEAARSQYAEAQADYQRSLDAQARANALLSQAADYARRSEAARVAGSQSEAAAALVLAKDAERQARDAKDESDQALALIADRLSLADKALASADLALSSMAAVSHDLGQARADLDTTATALTLARDETGDLREALDRERDQTRFLIAGLVLLSLLIVLSLAVIGGMIGLIRKPVPIQAEHVIPTERNGDQPVEPRPSYVYPSAGGLLVNPDLARDLILDLDREFAR